MESNPCVSYFSVALSGGRNEREIMLPNMFGGSLTS